MILASEFRREKKKFFFFWQVTCFLAIQLATSFGTYPKVNTTYDTHILAAMKVVKDFVSTSENVYLWQ